jgi:hypothetical protein
MGAEAFLSITDEDRQAVNRVVRELRALVSGSEWGHVGRGHVAWACMTLLAMVDVSFLNFSSR